MIRHGIALLCLCTFSISSHSQINWGILNQAPTPAQRYFEGQRQGAELERLRQETEKIRLENEQRRRQLEERRKQVDLEIQQEASKRQLEERKRQQEVAAKQSDDEIIKKWTAAALPRMGRYADFQQVVFAEDLRLTIPMINIMSESRYAADIAYFLGKDKEVSLQISKLDIVGARSEINRIEGLIRDRELLELQQELKSLRDSLNRIEANSRDRNTLGAGDKRP